ncbi:methyl-accepting chemotaxis protein, partial [Rhodovulum sulfidophilum]|nr:methyl-accepting chemotaxis protein [Rhodovulum sulfidophilum]
SAEANAEGRSVLALVMLIGALSAVVGSAAAIWITLSIGRGLRRALALTRRVAAGDLTEGEEVKGRDEIADLLGASNRMLEKLREVMDEVSGTARDVAAASGRMATAAGQLKSGTEEQASATVEASAAVEQMVGNIT